MYEVFHIIEGCDHDIQTIKNFHESNNKKSGELFVDKVEEFKWKLKCTAIGLE